MSKILEMLLDLTQHGYTSEDIKKSVIDTLTPFFEHPQKALQYWDSAELLSAFEFLIRYHYDDKFTEGLSEVLLLYRAAINQDTNQALPIICDTLFDFSQRENIMWTVRENAKKIDVCDYDEKIINYMKHIGDTLEIGTKHIVSEIWALMQVSEGITADYEKIQNLDFGVVIHNVLEKQRLTDILTTSPITIKLSDWRNIAYHHTYRIIDEQHISCTYGKKQLSFCISEEELTRYAHEIIRSSNILNIARCIIVFDYDELIDGYQSTQSKHPIRFRDSMLNSRLRISMLSQSFYLDHISEDPKIIIADIVDLLNNGMLSPEKRMERYIHSSQFLYVLWCTYKKEQVQIKYMSEMHVVEFTCSVCGDICEQINSGKKELRDLAQYVNFKFCKT